MKTKILIVAALAACLTTAQASIGESEAQITMRYGKPVGTSPTPTGTGKLYHFWCYIVIVMIAKGIARSEAYQRNDLHQIAAYKALFDTSARGFIRLRGFES